MILHRLALLPCILLVSCQEFDQESRGLPPEPQDLHKSSQVRDVSDSLSHHYDDKEWSRNGDTRKDRQIDDSVAPSQLSKDRITALFGADARPAYGHRDPDTGKVNLSPGNIQDRKGLSRNEPVDRVSEDIAEPESNDINPFQLFPPGFHDLLNIPIHDYGNGTTYNPHDKFKRPKQPLVSSGYANTKLQGGKDSEEYTEKPIKKYKYRSTTTTTTADYSSDSDFEPTKRPGVKYTRRPLNSESFKPKDGERERYVPQGEEPEPFKPKEEKRDRYIPQRKNPESFDPKEDERDRYVPQREQPESPKPQELERERYNPEYDLMDNREPFAEDSNKPYTPEYDDVPSAQPPVYTSQRNKNKNKRPKPEETFEDVRTYDRPYDQERYPPKQKERKPAEPYPTTFKKEKFFPEPTPSYTERPADRLPPVSPQKTEPPILKKPAHVYDDDIIYDYDDERNTGDKAVYFHVGKPESNILKETTNSHGLPPHVAEKERPLRPVSQFSSENQTPNFNSEFVPGLPQGYSREQPKQQAKVYSQQPQPEVRRPEFKPSATVGPQGGFPSVFNSDSPFSGPPGNPSQSQQRPQQPGFSRNDQPRPNFNRPIVRPQEGTRPQQVRPGPVQKEFQGQLRPGAGPASFPIRQDSFNGRPGPADVPFGRPPPGNFRQDFREPPREEQSSGPFSSITNIFSSMFGRRSNNRRKRSIDDEEPIAMESRSISEIRKLDRSELTAIQQAKEQVAPAQDGTPPHFYYYPPGKKVPLLVVGPFNGEAPLVEGAELVHVEAIADLPSVQDTKNDLERREDTLNPSEALGSPSSGFKKPLPADSNQQRKPSLEPSVPQKQTPVRNGVVFPKKKAPAPGATQRKPVEAVLDPVNSELSIPENVDTEEDQAEEPESESLTGVVASAVKNSVEKLKPLLRFRSKDSKKELITPNGQLANPGLVRPAKSGSVPDIPFAAPIHTIHNAQPQAPEQPSYHETAVHPAHVPLQPQNVAPSIRNVAPASIAVQEVDHQNAVPVMSDAAPASIPVRKDAVEVASPTSPELVQQQQVFEKAESDISNSEETEELPTAEKYVRIPVTSQMSENGVFIIQAASVPDNFNDRSDTISEQLNEKASPQTASLPVAQAPSQRQGLVNTGPGLPPLNLPTGLIQQLSGLSPPQNLAQPIAIRQAPQKQPIPVPSSLPAAPTPFPTSPLRDNRPPLFPLGAPVGPGTPGIQSDPGLRPSQPPPLVQAMPPIAAPSFSGFSGESQKPKQPTPVFFSPLSAAKTQTTQPITDQTPAALKPNRSQLLVAPEGPEPGANTKFSPTFNPDTVKTFKVGSDGKPVTARPRPRPTTERIATLPPGVTPGPPKLVGLGAPFIPSQRVSQSEPEDSAVSASNPNAAWLGVGNIPPAEDQTAQGSNTQHTQATGDPFIEVGGFVPIFHQ